MAYFKVNIGIGWSFLSDVSWWTGLGIRCSIVVWYNFSSYSMMYILGSLLGLGFSLFYLCHMSLWECCTRTQVHLRAEVACQFDLLFCCSTQFVSPGMAGSWLCGRGCLHELTVERGCYLVSVFKVCVHASAHTVMAHCVIGVWFCTSTSLNNAVLLTQCLLPHGFTRSYGSFGDTICLVVLSEGCRSIDMGNIWRSLVVHVQVSTPDIFTLHSSFSWTLR